MAALTCCCAVGCASGGYVDGPEYSYKITDKTDDYVLNFSDSDVVVDAGITLDGVFDEDFYGGREWFRSKKVQSVSGGVETGTLEMTTYFSTTGIVVAAHIIDSRPAIYSSTISTGNQTCFSGYFAFPDDSSQGNNVYEVECTAGNRFKISKFTNGSLSVMTTDRSVTPVSAVKRIGDITKGECYEYYVEYFMPYALFGRTECTDVVYFNPTMISATMDEYGEAENDLRTWYNFGANQSSLYGWGKPNSGYVFDSNGFISNDLTIEVTGGGTVEEEYGYDWCITGDTIKFTVTPDEGKTLTSLTVNGRDYTTAGQTGAFSYTCTGDVAVVAQFS